MLDWEKKEYIEDACWSIIGIVLHAGIVLGLIWAIGYGISETIREPSVPNKEVVVVKEYEYTSDDFSKVESLLNEYGRVMFEYDLSGNLKSVNNPYGIMIGGELVEFSSVEEAHKFAMMLLHKEMKNYNVKEEPIMHIFSTIFEDSMYYTNIPDEPIRW